MSTNDPDLLLALRSLKDDLNKFVSDNVIHSVAKKMTDLVTSWKKQNSFVT